MIHQTLQKKNLISIRDFYPADFNFIISTWLKGAYLGNNFYQLIDKKSYYQNYDPAVKRILQRKTTEVKVCCLKEDPGVILGYAVLEKRDIDILHWVFVKFVWRGIGIMKDLLEPYDIKATTHLTQRFIKTKPKRIKFDPFLI